MDAVGQRPARFRKAVRHRLVCIRECQTAVSTQTMCKAGHVLMVLASIKCLDQCEVQRINAHMENAHACTALVGVIRAGTTKANTDLAVREAGFLIQQRINELLCLVHELLHFCLGAVQRTALRHIIGAKCNQKVIDALIAVGFTVLLEVQPTLELIPESIGLSLQNPVAL